jgi:hypothetical protein
MAQNLDNFSGVIEFHFRIKFWKDKQDPDRKMFGWMEFVIERSNGDPQIGKTLVLRFSISLGWHFFVAPVSFFTKFQLLKRYGCRSLSWKFSKTTRHLILVSFELGRKTFPLPSTNSAPPIVFWRKRIPWLSRVEKKFQVICLVFTNGILLKQRSTSFVELAVLTL